MSSQGDQVRAYFRSRRTMSSKAHAAASADLPESGDSRLGLKQSAAMPDVVLLDFVGKWRTGPD